jgi:hypothetical protein
LNTKSKLPTRPIKPPNLTPLKTNSKTKVPKTKVFNGVKEFRIEVTELSISVWANAKGKPAQTCQNIEVITIYFHLCFGIFGKLLKPINNKKTAANIIRKDPTCIADNPIKPLFY